MTQGTHDLFKIEVKESLLLWAMKRSNKSVAELSKRQNLRKIGEWLAGTGKPTRPQLEAFAKATYTPFGYLLLPEPPHERPPSVPHFRTVKNVAPPMRSVNLEDTIRIVKRRQEWASDYLKEIGAKPLDFVGSSKIGDDPIDVANDIRAKLGLKQSWTAKYTKWKSAQDHLQKRMEDARIFLSANSVVQYDIHRKLDPEEFRGFVLVDEYAPFVFVNSADMGGAQMFTLAHELAHVWVGASASFDLRRLAPAPEDDLELACNRIAAEFLAPTKEMRRRWDEFVDSADGPYKAASRHFKVSRIVAARRALDTKCIPKREFDKFYDDYVRQAQQEQQGLKGRQQERRGGPSFYHTAPSRISKRFLQTVITAVGERRILYREAYSLTGLKSETFDEIRMRLGGASREQ